MTRRNLIATAFASLGGLTVGAGLLAQQSRIGDPGQRIGAPTQPAPKGSEPAALASKALVEARLATAREIVLSQMQGHETASVRSAIPSADDTPVWSRRWMDEELRLRTDPVARLAAIADHLERTKRLEQMADNLARSGHLRHSDALKVRYYRLEAEQILLEARATTGNLPVPAPTSKAAAEGSGTPHSAS
jgi:hypothetical protein